MEAQVRNATIDDLLREQWLRRRDSGQIIWTNEMGDRIAIKNLSDQHLQNAIDNCLKSNESKS